MSDNREVVGWFTANGKHVPIFNDEPSENDKKKDREIAQSEKQASERNGATSSVVKDAEKKLGFKLGKPIHTYSSGATEYKPKGAYVTDKEEYDSYIKLMKNSILSHFVNYYSKEAKEKLSSANVDFSDDGFIVAYNSRGGKHYFKVKLPVDTVMRKASGKIVTHPKLNGYEYDAVGGELGEKDLDKLD